MDLEMASSNLRFTNGSDFYSRRSQQTESPLQFDGATNDLFSFEHNVGNNVTPDNSIMSNSTINTYNDMAALLAANNISTDSNTSFDDILALSQTNLESFLENPGTKSSDSKNGPVDESLLMQQMANSNQVNQLMMMDQSQSQMNLPKLTNGPAQGLHSYVAKLAQLYYPMPHLSSALASLLNTSPSNTVPHQQQHQQQQSALTNLKPSTNTMAAASFSLSQLVPRPKIDLISPVLKIPRLRLKSSRKYESMNKPSQPPTPATEFNYNIFNNHIANLNNQQKLGHAPWPSGLPSAMLSGESNMFENNPSVAANSLHLTNDETPTGSMNYHNPSNDFTPNSLGQAQQNKAGKNNLGLSSQNNINFEQQQKIQHQYINSVSQPSSMSISETVHPMHDGSNRNKFKNQFHQMHNQPMTIYRNNADQQQTTDLKTTLTPLKPTSIGGGNVQPYIIEYMKQGSNDINPSQQHLRNAPITFEHQGNHSGSDQKVRPGEPLNYDQADSILYDTFSFLGYKGQPNQTKQYQQTQHQFPMDNNNINLLSSSPMQPNQIMSSTTTGWLNPKLFNYQQYSQPSTRPSYSFNYMNGDTNQQLELSSQKHFPSLMNSLFNSNNNNNQANKYHTNQQSPSIAKPSLTKLWFASSPFRGASGMSMMQQAASNLAGRHPHTYHSSGPSLFMRQKPQHFPYSSSNSPLSSLSKLPFTFSSMLTNSNEHHTNHIAMPLQQQQQQPANQMQHTTLTQNQDTSTYQSAPQIQSNSDNGQQISHSFSINTEPNHHVQQQAVNNNHHLVTQQNAPHQVANNQHDISGGSGGPDYMMAVERFSKQSSESRPSSIINPINGQQVFFQPVDADGNKINLQNIRHEIVGQKSATVNGDKIVNNNHSPYFLMMKSNNDSMGRNGINYQQITSEDGKMITRFEMPKPFELDYLSMSYLNNSGSPASEPDQMVTAAQQHKLYSTTNFNPSQMYSNNTINNNDLVTKYPSSLNYQYGNASKPVQTLNTDNNTKITAFDPNQLDTTRQTFMWNYSKGSNAIQPITESIMLSSMVLPAPINFTRDLTTATTPSLDNIHLSSYNFNSNTNSAPLVPLERPTVSPGTYLDPRYQINSVFHHNRKPQPPIKVASTIASHISASRSLENFLLSTPGSSGNGNFIVLDSSPNEKMTSQAQLRPRYIGRFLTPPHLMTSSHPHKTASMVDDKYKIIGHQFDRLSSLSSPPSTSIALDPMVAAHSIPSIISGQLIGFASPDGQSLHTRLPKIVPKIAHGNESSGDKENKSKSMMNFLQDIALGDVQPYSKKDTYMINNNSNKNKYNHKLIDDQIFTKYIPKLISSTARPTIATYYIKDKSQIDTSNQNQANSTNHTSDTEQNQLSKELTGNKLPISIVDSHQTPKVPQIPLPHTEKMANYSATLPTSDNDTDHTILSHVLSLISTNAVAPPVVSVASSPDARFWSDSLNQRYDFIDYEINRRRR